MFCVLKACESVVFVWMKETQGNAFTIKVRVIALDVNAYALGWTDAGGYESKRVRDADAVSPLGLQAQATFGVAMELFASQSIAAYFVQK